MKHIRFDYSGLQKRVTQIFESMPIFLSLVGISSSEWFCTMSGERFFTQSQIAVICLLLMIEDDEIVNYFFRSKIKFS